VCATLGDIPLSPPVLSLLPVLGRGPEAEAIPRTPVSSPPDFHELLFNLTARWCTDESSFVLREYEGLCFIPLFFSTHFRSVFVRIYCK